MLLNDDNFEMQGGVRNYLGKTEEVKAPKYWKSSKDSPSTELVYITEAEKGLLADANLHGSLKDGKPNVGASGLLSYDGWGDSDGQGGSDTSGGNAGAEGGQGDGGGGYNSNNNNDANPGDQDTFNPETGTTPSSTPSNNNNNNDNNYTVPDPVLPPGVNDLNVDAEDEYLAPDTDHYKATQKAIKFTIEGKDGLNEQGLNKSDWTDYTKEQQDIYQAEMNRLNGTENKNYSFYKGNKGTTNLTFDEHFKDVAATNPTIAKFSPTMRLLVAAGRTIQENATTSYGTGSYGSGGTDGSGAAVDQGGWIGKVLNSDGSVKSTLTESEAQNIYQQAQSQLPYQIGNTKPQKSMVNDFFKNMGSNLGVSTTYMNTYNQAKNKISQSLNLTPNTQQFGYTASPYSNYSRSMTSANPYYDELENQGLI